MELGGAKEGPARNTAYHMVAGAAAAGIDLTALDKVGSLTDRGLFTAIK